MTQSALVGHKCRLAIVAPHWKFKMYRRVTLPIHVSIRVMIWDVHENWNACRCLAPRCHVMWGHPLANFLYHYNGNCTLEFRHLQYQKVHTIQMDEHVILTSCVTSYEKCQNCKWFWHDVARFVRTHNDIWTFDVMGADTSEELQTTPGSLYWTLTENALDPHACEYYPKMRTALQ